MIVGRSLRGFHTVFLSLAMAALAGGCASALTAPTTGLIDLEPAKGAESKSATHNIAANPTAHQSASPSDAAAASPDTPAMNVGLTTKAAPLGSGFPPLNPMAAADPTRDLNALAAEMQALGTISLAEQQALLDDLRQSDPAAWPQLVHQFRLAMAYRSRGQGSGTRDQASAAESPSEVSLAAPPPATAAEPGNEKRDSAPPTTATSDSNSPRKLASAEAEPLPREPALRPPLKKQEKKVVELAAVVSNEPAAAKTPNPAAAKPAESSATPSTEAQLQLTKAILAIEGEAAGGPASGAASAGSLAANELLRQMTLRLLYLTAGRRDDALRPISGLSPAQQEFWTKEIYGLATYLDAGRGDPDRRAAEAALHLREAAARIGELASPVVRNLAFCKEVTSFGVFKRFPKYEFKPGEEALLYCEIENLKAESTDKGFHTAVKGSYQILDSRGERVAEQEFPTSDDHCASPRRDFFIPYFIAIPKRINDGNYTLQLTIEDTATKKVGQASIQFSVK